MRREPRINNRYDAPGTPPVWRLRLLTLALLASFFAIGWQLTALGRGSAFAWVRPLRFLAVGWLLAAVPAVACWLLSLVH